MTEPIEVVDETPEQVPEPEPEAPAEPTPAEQEAEEQEEPGEPSGPVEEPQGAGAVVGMGEKEIEKMHKRLEVARNTYARKLGDILGEEAAQLEPCPRCLPTGIAGFVFPLTMAPIDAEAKTAVLLSVGEEPPQVSEPDQFSRRCDACKGWGRVLSGSKLNAEKTLRCIPCGGRGWVAVGDERRVPQQAVAAPATPNGAESPVEQPPDTDPWGRGPDDPDYGRMPQFVGRR